MQKHSHVYTQRAVRLEKYTYIPSHKREMSKNRHVCTHKGLHAHTNIKKHSTVPYLGLHVQRNTHILIHILSYIHGKTHTYEIRHTCTKMYKRKRTHESMHAVTHSHTLTLTHTRTFSNTHSLSWGEAIPDPRGFDSLWGTLCSQHVPLSWRVPPNQPLFPLNTIKWP